VDINSSGVIQVYAEDFENTDLSTNGFVTENPDNQNTWEIATTAGNTPGNKSAFIDIFDNQTRSGQKDAFITPAINLSQTSNNVFYFQHAHRRRASSQNDSLNIYATINDGLNWDKIFARAEAGTGSFATAGLLTTFFTPQNSDDWCLTGTIGTSCLNVDISDYDGASNFKLKFEVVNDAGNNIYLDNFKVLGNCQVPLSLNNIPGFKGFRLYPNPANTVLMVELEEASSGNITIIDLTGRIIKTETINNNRLLQLEVSNLPKGIFFLRLQTKKGTIVKSFIHS
jgi:hypothetical protein